MNLHPYIGLHGTVRIRPFHGPGARANDYTGTVAAVGQGGSQDEGFYVVAVIRRDTPHPVREDAHDECPLSSFDPDDPAEAARRLAEAFGKAMAVKS